MTAKTIVTFICPSVPVPNEDIGTTPGLPIAERLIAGLPNSSVEVETQAPIEGEGGWSIWLKTKGVTFRLFLSVAGIGDATNEKWAIGVGPTVFFRWFRRNRADEALRELAPKLEHTLIKELACGEVQWWDGPTFCNAVSRDRQYQPRRGGR